MNASSSFVRKVMQPKVSGEQALAKLREIAKKRDEIERRYNRALAEAKEFQSECDSSWRDFIRDPCSIGDLRKVAMLRVQAEVATEMFGHLYRRGDWINQEFLRTTDLKELRRCLLSAVRF